MRMSMSMDMQSVAARRMSSAPAPFVPTDLANLLAWHDPADAATITDAGSGAVSQWSDKSGNGYHLTQATGTFRPTTGIRSLNGVNLLDFDGSSDVLQRVISDASSYLAGQNSFTKYLLKHNDATSGYAEGYLSNNTGMYVNAITGSGGVLGKMVNADGFYSGSGSGTVGSVDIVAVRVQRNAAPQLYINGVLRSMSGVASDNAVTPLVNQYISVGSSQVGFGYFDGGIGDRIEYLGYHSNADMNKVGNYLKTKYNATWTDI